MFNWSGWWFQTFFIFHNIWDNPFHWLYNIFQRGSNHQPVVNQSTSWEIITNSGMAGPRGHDAIRCCLRWGRSSSNTGPGSQLDTSKEKNISKGHYKLVENHGTLINFMALKCLEYLQFRFETYMDWLWWGWLVTSLVITTSDYVVDVTLLTCLTTWRQPMILDHFGQKPKRPPFSVIRP